MKNRYYGQLFSEEQGTQDTNDNVGTPEEKGGQTDPTPEPKEKTFTQAELDKIVADRLKRAEKSASKAAEIAEKATQKTANERIEALEAQLAAMTAERELAETKVTVRSLLTEAKVEGVPDEIVDMLSAGDAEAVAAQVEAFTKFLTARDKEVVKGHYSKSKQPTTGRTSGAMTMEEIQKVENPLERQELIRKYMLQKETK